MKDVLTEIFDWSASQPGWQRDALRRLFTTGICTPADIDDLLEVCKAQYGLSKPRAPQALS